MQKDKNVQLILTVKESLRGSLKLKALEKKTTLRELITPVLEELAK